MFVCLIELGIIKRKQWEDIIAQYNNLPKQEKEWKQHLRVGLITLCIVSSLVSLMDQ